MFSKFSTDSSSNPSKNRSNDGQMNLVRSTILSYGPHQMIQLEQIPRIIEQLHSLGPSKTLLQWQNTFKSQRSKIYPPTWKRSNQQPLEHVNNILSKRMSLQNAAGTQSTCGFASPAPSLGYVPNFNVLPSTTSYNSASSAPSLGFISNLNIPPSTSTCNSTSPASSSGYSSNIESPNLNAPPSTQVKNEIPIVSQFVLPQDFRVDPIPEVKTEDEEFNENLLIESEASFSDECEVVGYYDASLMNSKASKSIGNKNIEKPLANNNVNPGRASITSLTRTLEAPVTQTVTQTEVQKKAPNSSRNLNNLAQGYPYTNVSSLNVSPNLTLSQSAASAVAEVGNQTTAIRELSNSMAQLTAFLKQERVEQKQREKNEEIFKENLLEVLRSLQVQK